MASEGERTYQINCRFPNITGNEATQRSSLCVIEGKDEEWYLQARLDAYTQSMLIKLRRNAKKDEKLLVRLENITVENKGFRDLALQTRNRSFGSEWYGSYYPCNFFELEFAMQGRFVVSGYSNKLSITNGKQQKIQFDLVKDLKRMYDDNAFWDVTFRLGVEELKAHKFVLVARSPVFAAMFEHQMKEKNTNEIPIEDFDRHTFNCFLLALYTGEIEDKTWDTVLALHRAGSKYHVSWLMKMCSEMLSSGLTSKNVCSVLVQSYRHNDTKLKNKAQNYVLCCFNEVGACDEWMDIITDIPLLATEVLVFITSSNMQKGC